MKFKLLNGASGRSKACHLSNFMDMVVTER